MKKAFALLLILGTVVLLGFQINNPTGGGSGTVSSAAAAGNAYYSAAGTTVSADTSITDDGAGKLTLLGLVAPAAGLPITPVSGTSSIILLGSAGASAGTITVAGSTSGTATVGCSPLGACTSFGSTTTTLTGSKFNTGGNCAASGTAANPSVVSCSSSSAGAVALSTAASAGTCQINTTAVSANSEIMVQIVSDEGTRLSVTCNTAPTSVPTILLTTKTAATSFVVAMPTFSTNPLCLDYYIVN